MSKVNLEKFINNAPVGKIITLKFKNKKRYELVKYHDGIIGMRDCIVELEFAETINENDWNISNAKYQLEKWFKNNAPDELLNLCDVTIPSITNVFGRDNWLLLKESGEIQFDLFKDYHNRVKFFDGMFGEDLVDWWTKTPFNSSKTKEYEVVCIDFSGQIFISMTDEIRGLLPIFIRRGN